MDAKATGSIPTRSDFRRAVYGVLGSFLSRNNDVGGYWGIGVLYRHAQEHRSRSVKIDLLAGQMVPQGQQFDKMLDTYGRLLTAQFKRCEHPEQWLRTARIYLEFDTTADIADVFEATATDGSPYICIAQIVCSQGQRYTVQTRGRCHLHDPLLETKSNRAQA
jgi:hypothetical protein